MIKQNTVRRLLMAVGIAAAASITQAQPGTSFTYQGQLKSNGTLVDTLIMADFSLFDAAAGGTQIGSTISQPITPDMGIFSTDLDFGVSAYTANQALWLEISVDGELLGRQKLSATPFAMNTRGMSVDANGNAAIDNRLTIKGRELFFPDFWDIGAEANNEFSINETNIAPRLTVVQGGHVGIGTTTPSRLLTVQDLSANAFIGMVSPTETGILFATSAGGTNGGVVYNSDVADGLSFRTSLNFTRMVIDNAGRVGIGTSSPGVALDVVGTVRADNEVLVSGSSSINVVLGETVGGANRGKVLVLNENSLARSVIAYDAAGLGFMQTDNYFTNSDRRLKTEIHELSDALETVGALRGVTYQWKDKAEAGDQIGFIAQEVELVLPELVSTNPETGYKSVAYANVVAVLVEAMHDQQDQIELMQAEIDSLKSGNIALIRRPTK